MSCQETINFIRDHATLEDLREIRDVFSWRLRELQRRGAQVFQPDERVLFVDGDVERPALILRVSRRFITVCLGNQRHVRCDASFLKKILISSTSPESVHTELSCTIR